MNPKRQERMAAFLARGGAFPPGGLPKAAPAETGARPRPQRAPRTITFAERERCYSEALEDARALQAQAMAAKCFVPIGPRHLQMLIELAEKALPSRREPR